MGSMAKSKFSQAIAALKQIPALLRGLEHKDISENLPELEEALCAAGKPIQRLKTRVKASRKSESAAPRTDKDNAKAVVHELESLKQDDIMSNSSSLISEPSTTIQDCLRDLRDHRDCIEALSKRRRAARGLALMMNNQQLRMKGGSRLNRMLSQQDPNERLPGNISEYIRSIKCTDESGLKDAIQIGTNLLYFERSPGLDPLISRLLRFSKKFGKVRLSDLERLKAGLKESITLNEMVKRHASWFNSPANTNEGKANQRPDLASFANNVHTARFVHLDEYQEPACWRPGNQAKCATQVQPGTPGGSILTALLNATEGWTPFRVLRLGTRQSHEKDYHQAAASARECDWFGSSQTYILS